jgi:chemotaxis protein CheZ
MPNDPLAQILVGLPDEADYAAVHTALMATDRGRRFLTEFADRHRHADTTAIVSAIARIEATLRGDGPPRADAAGDLMEIAAAIDRVQAALAAGTPPAADISAAIERRLDIAFTLHERPVEATLCDGLDAAIREISQTSMRSESSAEGIREAAELVRALAGRVREMMALSSAVRETQQPAGANVDATSGAGLFELATNDGETFAQAVAELAASLPALTDAPSEPVDAAPEPELGPESGEGAPAPAAEIAPSDNVLLPAVEAQQTVTEIGNPDNDIATSQIASTDLSLSEAVLSQVSDDFFSSPNFSSEAPAREETESAQALSEEPPSEAPTQNFPTEPVPGPQEDPADLFEPASVATPPAEAAAPVTTDAAVPAEPPAEPPRVVPPPPARAIPRPPGSDPLAAVRDLSEEELIALFS